MGAIQQRRPATNLLQLQKLNLHVEVSQNLLTRSIIPPHILINLLKKKKSIRGNCYQQGKKSRENGRCHVAWQRIINHVQVSCLILKTVEKHRGQRTVASLASVH